MKLTILQENLAKAVSQAARFVNVRSQLPILGNILLRADKTKLTVASTNLEISVLTQIGAKIEKEGEISIPAKVLSELINNLPKENINLESEKEQMQISSPGFTSKVLGMNASDFPKIPSSLSKSYILPKQEVLESLLQTLFATSVDETRPILTGVLFVIEKDTLILVATDGFRLSKKKIKIESQKIEGIKKIIVPKGVLAELGRDLDTSSELKIEIQDKEKQIVFGLTDLVLSSRILEGDYPDFEKIIPKESKITVRIDKEEFLRAIKLASVFARESANIVKLKFKKDSVYVLAESSSSGNQETRVDIKLEGDNFDPFEVSFNYRFLEEFLHSVTGEEVKMQFTTPDKAGIFTDPKDNNYLHLIMPVKIQN